MKLSFLGIGDGDEAIKNTLLQMKHLILNSDKEDSSRIIKETAKNIVKTIPSNDYPLQVKTVVGWVRRNLKYCRDLFGVEELTSPVRILYNIKEGRNTHSSDCDDYSIVIAALLRALGFRTMLQAVSVQGGRYDHARCAVYLKGEWVVIEGTKNIPVGQAQPSQLPIMYVEVI